MQSVSIKQQIGEALRDVQRGINIGMPLSRPMPSIGPGVHELRITDEKGAIRIMYMTKYADAILVFHGFHKRTQKTPVREIEVAQKRLKEMF